MTSLTAPASPFPSIPGELSETGLSLQQGLLYEEWERVGQLLQRVEKSVRWWIGDWIRYGERTYGDRTYAQAAEVTGFTEGDLRQMTHVASRFELLERSNNLSWSHHKEVAGLEPAVRREWLATAEENDWSTRELKQRIKGAQKNVTPQVPTCKRCGKECNWCRIDLTPA